MSKDIEWLTERVLTKIKSAELNVKAHEGVLADDFESRAIAYKKVLKDINQLDEPDSDYAYQKGFREGERQTAEYFESVTEEPSYAQVQKYLSEHGIKIADKDPEVLSQEWIDKNKTSIDRKLDGTPIYKVREELLQNLLVPKQELPVIPKFVANFIRATKPSNSLRVAFEYIAQRKRYNYDDELAFWIEEGNSELFARAWLDGCTVEEEQKYQVIIRDGEYMRLYLCKYGNNVTIGTNEYYIERYPEVTYLTEQEIKDYDKRYWPFAVKK